jgi:hypothetical protein
MCSAERVLDTVFLQEYRSVRIFLPYQPIGWIGPVPDRFCSTILGFPFTLTDVTRSSYVAPFRVLFDKVAMIHPIAIWYNQYVNDGIKHDFMSTLLGKLL